MAEIDRLKARAEYAKSSFEAWGRQITSGSQEEIQQRHTAFHEFMLKTQSEYEAALADSTTDAIVGASNSR